jgi:Peptidase family M49
MKKISISGFLVLIIFLISCNQENYDYLYQNFMGTISPTEQIDEKGERIMLPAQDISIRFDKNKVFYNGQEGSYSIIENTDEYLSISAVVAEDTGGQTIELKYLKDKKWLILSNNKDFNKIILMTDEVKLENTLNSFTRVSLTSDISHLSDDQKEMLKILYQVADIMDEIYWLEAYGDKDKLMGTTNNPTLKALFEINYGPWERLNNDQPFSEIYGDKPEGANFYPRDMSKEEFENFDNENKSSLYTVIQRDKEGKLKTLWYHEAFGEKITLAASLLQKAALLAKDQGFKDYLNLRAEALLTDNYFESDVAWMKMKDNDIDFVVGPIENYEDKLFNYKAAHESFILIKDWEWSNKLIRLAGFLPMLQKELPVPPVYKKETPGTNSDLNVYDAVYYGGDCNAGSKTIAINLPNDPAVRSAYGSRKLQLKNSIRYKFEQILVPISNVLIAENQRKYIDFDAFFENTMFHEVAHGLGLDYTIDGKSTVREALKETYSSIEEGKADILGLYIVSKLNDMGELGDKDLMTNYVTFMAGIFRSVRFGAASAHGKANMIRFYYFQEAGAFSRDEVTGTYSVNFDKMKEAMQNLTFEIITLQGDGDYAKAKHLIEEKGFIREDLQNDLNRLNELSIPVDIVFEQGPDVLGL